MSARESRKATLSVQYFESLAPVDESDVLIVPMKAYDLVLGLPWFKARNPEIDSKAGRLTALGTPSGPQATTTMDENRDETPYADTNGTSQGHGGKPPDICPWSNRSQRPS